MKNNEEFTNIEKEDIENEQKQEEKNINEKFFSASFANIIGSAGKKLGVKIGGAMDSIAEFGRNAKKKFKSTMKSVDNKISNAGSSIKTKALGLRVSSNMNSFYMLKLKEVLESYSGSDSKEDFELQIKRYMAGYKEFVTDKVKSWLNNEEREKALESKINAGYDELKEKYDKLDYSWLEKKIPSFGKKIRIEILKNGDCIKALKNHLKKYGKIDPLWDILTRGSKITRSGALKSKTISLLSTMTDSLSDYEGNEPMNVGVYSNSLMSYLLKNFKGKGEKKDQDWKLQCGLLLVRYSQQEGSYFDSLGKMVDERLNKIHKSISQTSKLVKLQKSCKSIQEMLDKASGSKKGTASIAIGVGMSYSNPVAIEVIKKVYTSNKIDIEDSEIQDIQKHSGSISELIGKVSGIIIDKKISKYDTDSGYQKWSDDLHKIVEIKYQDGILDKIKNHKHLKYFKNDEKEFEKYMKKEYKKSINNKYGETLKEYEDLLENLKKDLDKYSGEEFSDGRNPQLFKFAEKNLKEFKYRLSDDFIRDEICKENGFDIEELRKDCKKWLDKIDQDLKKISHKLPLNETDKNQPITESEYLIYMDTLGAQKNKVKEYSKFFENDKDLGKRINQADNYINEYLTRVKEAKIEKEKTEVPQEGNENENEEEVQQQQEEVPQEGNENENKEEVEQQQEENKEEASPGQ